MSTELVSAPSVHEKPARAANAAGRSTAAQRFLIAAGVSFYGDWLTTVALVVLLYRLTGDSAAAPALYMAVRVAPRIVGPTFGGSLVDRFGPARVAADCAIFQGGLTALIVLLASEHIVWGIYVCVAAAQFLNSLAQPSYGALIPRVARPDQLGRVNGLYSGLFASSILVSPAIGALLLPHVAPQMLIAIDAATFVAAAVLMTTLRPLVPPITERGPQRLSAGVPLVLRDPALRAYAAAACGNSAAITALQAVLVVAASQRFGHDTSVGWLYAAVGAGGVIGALSFLRRTPRRVRAWQIFVATFLELGPLAGFVFTSSLPVAVVLLAVSSFGGVVYQTRGSIGLQQRIRTSLLGRASGVIRTSFYIGMLIGAVTALLVVQLFGWQSTVLAVAGFAVVLVVMSAALGPHGEREPAPGFRRFWP